MVPDPDEAARRGYEEPFIDCPGCDDCPKDPQLTIHALTNLLLDAVDLIKFGIDCDCQEHKICRQCRVQLRLQKEAVPLVHRIHSALGQCEEAFSETIRLGRMENDGVAIRSVIRPAHKATQELLA